MHGPHHEAQKSIKRNLECPTYSDNHFRSPSRVINSNIYEFLQLHVSSLLFFVFLFAQDISSAGQPRVVFTLFLNIIIDTYISFPNFFITSLFKISNYKLHFNTQIFKEYQIFYFIHIR